MGGPPRCSRGNRRVSVKRRNFSMLNGTPQSDHLNMDLVDRVKAVVDADGLTQAQVAREADISTAAMSGFINRKPLSNQTGTESQLTRWLEARGDREALTLPSIPDWLETPTAARILNTAAFAHQAQAMAVISSPPGLGKTVTLRRYRQTRPNVWMATMAPSSATLVPALKSVARALGKKGRLPAGAQDLTQEIAEHVTDKLGLLMIDEAQHLELKALEEVRAIHDMTGVGLVLAGNETVYSRLTGGEREANFAQLFSRVGKRLALRRPARDDVRVIAGAWQASERETLKFLEDKATLPGGLRQITFALRMATMFARGEGREVGLDDIKRAWVDLNFENGERRG